MTKIYAERLVKGSESEDQILSGSFRLRLLRDDFVFFRPHFKALIQNTGVPLVPINEADAVEGIFTVPDNSNSELVEGVFHADEKIMTDYFASDEYEVTVEEEIPETAENQLTVGSSVLSAQLNDIGSNNATQSSQVMNNDVDDQPQYFTYTVSAIVFTTPAQREKWKDLPLDQILADLGSEYDAEKIRADFAEANPDAGKFLDAWIKKSIIDYGWRAGQTPTDILQTSVEYTTDHVPIIESFRASDAYNIALRDEHLKEFQSYYWKGKVSGKIQLRTIYLGSQEAIYNKKYVDQAGRKELIEDLLLASGDQDLYDKALAEKNTGEAFAALVTSAQQVLFYANPGEVDGKLGPKTFAALMDWKTKCQAPGFDPYIERLARRLASEKIPNDAARKKEAADKEKETQQLIEDTKNYGELGVQSRARETALNKRFGSSLTPTKPAYANDPAIIQNLIKKYPRVKTTDNPLLISYTSAAVTDDRGNSNVVTVEWTDADLIGFAYDRLQSQQQAPVNQMQFDQEDISQSDFSNQYSIFYAQANLIHVLVPESGGGKNGGSDVALGTKVESIKNSPMFIAWKNARDSFVNSDVLEMGTDGDKQATELSPLVHTLDNEIAIYIAEQARKNTFLSGRYDQMEDDYVFNYSGALDIMVFAGNKLVSDLEDAVKAEKFIANDPRLEAISQYQDRVGGFARYNDLIGDENTTGEVRPMKAVFQTNEMAQNANEYNPATGSATPSVYKMEMYLEKRSEDDFSLHIFFPSSDAEDITVVERSLYDCMIKLAEYQQQLPDGTIFYYDPFATDPLFVTMQHEQRIEGHASASELFGFAGLGMALLSLIPPLGAVFIIGSAFAGAASSVCYMYEKNAVGQLTKGDVELESANIVASLLPAIGALARLKVFTTLSKVKAFESYGQELAGFNKFAASVKFIRFAAVVDLGVMVANGVSMTQDIIEALAKIDGMSISEPEKNEMRRRILMQAFFAALIMVVALKSNVEDIVNPKVHIDESGLKYKVKVKDGEHFRLYDDGTEVKMKPDEVQALSKPIILSSAETRPSTLHSDGQGNYYKRYTDNGEQVPISKADFEAGGGKELKPGRYMVYSVVEEGNTKYKRKNLDTQEVDDISSEDFFNAQVKSITQQKIAAATEAAIVAREEALKAFKEAITKALVGLAIGATIDISIQASPGGPLFTIAGALAGIFRGKGKAFIRTVINTGQQMTDEELIFQVKNELRNMDELKPHFDEYSKTAGAKGDALDNTRLKNDDGTEISLEDYIKKTKREYKASLKTNITKPKYQNGSGNGLTGSGWTFNSEKDVDWRGNGATYQDALDEAFRRTGVPQEEFTITKTGKTKYGKDIPVEWEGPNKEKVNMDIPEWNNIKPSGNIGEGPVQPHIGYENGGQGKYRTRGHIFVDDVPATR